MFFSTYVLTKKGPLAKIWLAAHWDKKLTKNEVRVIDLNQSVVQIVQPVVPIALRTSGELMVGVVRIYSLKVRHLLKDATDATMLLLRPKNVQMVKGKGEKESAAAVTMDIVVARAAQGAEQLAEADFAGIADILGSKDSKAAGDLLSAKPAAGEDVIGTAWFTTESSQFVEEPVGATQDEIAKIRADLRAFGDNRDATTSTSKSKSSLSSMEKGRQSGAAPGAAAVDLLDIGAPAPDDLEFIIPAVDGAAALADPFAPMAEDAPAPNAVPDVEDALPTKMARKIKPVNILDTADTVMSKEQVRKNIADTRDVVNAERRHGPLDRAEVHDRQTIVSGEQNIVNCQPLSDIVGPGLRAVYEAALRTSVAKAVEKMESARGGDDQRPTGRVSDLLAGDDAAPLNISGQGEMPAPEDMFRATDEEPENPKKRKRGQDAPARDGFSASAIATLDRIRDKLKGRAERTTHAHLAPTKTATRREAARTFVDVLALASHGFVEVVQAKPFGDIAILKTTKMMSDPVVGTA